MRYRDREIDSQTETGERQEGRQVRQRDRQAGRDG